MATSRLYYRVRLCGMIIRSARPEDALRIATIHVDAWRAAYSGIIPDEYLRSLSIEKRHALWQQDLEAGHPFTWVAEESDSVLGWISAAASRDADASQSTGEIWAVYIDPSHWGEGAGRALCDAAEQELRRRGCTEVTLWVLKDNQRALGFYRSNGFSCDASEDRIIE